MTRRYRPWGPAAWLLPRLGPERWSMLGVLGTEERCASLAASIPSSAVADRRFLLIRDPSPINPAAFEKRYGEIGDLLGTHGVLYEDVREVELLADTDTIREAVASFLADAGQHVVIDITSMPKRWFFPVIRELMASAQVQTLVATYAGAVEYGDQLASDPEPLAPIPTFNDPPSRTSNEVLVIGVGFAALSLRDLYSAAGDDVRYLFPFPPGPPNFLRNWDFLRTLEAEIENRIMAEEDRSYVDLFDCPGAFDAMCEMTSKGTRTTALAPFGPKPMSLAMCMFALAVGRKSGLPPVHVHYTQPTRYDLEYSRGMAMTDDVPDVKAYTLKMGGAAIYEVQ